MTLVLLRFLTWSLSVPDLTSASSHHRWAPLQMGIHLHRFYLFWYTHTLGGREAADSGKFQHSTKTTFPESWALLVYLRWSPGWLVPGGSKPTIVMISEWKIGVWGGRAVEMDRMEFSLWKRIFPDGGEWDWWGSNAEKSTNKGLRCSCIYPVNPTLCTRRGISWLKFK